MSEPGIVQGRRIGAAELEQIRHLLAVHPCWSRRQLSGQLALLWDWRNPAGQLKDMAARSLLLKLEQRGWIRLPPRRQVPCNRMRSPPPPLLERPISEAPITEPLSALRPLTITEVSRPGSAHRDLFEALLRQHHYLGHRGTVGENLQYLVCDGQGRPWLVSSLARRLGSVPTGIDISDGTPPLGPKACICSRTTRVF